MCSDRKRKRNPDEYVDTGMKRENGNRRRKVQASKTKGSKNLKKMLNS